MRTSIMSEHYGWREGRFVFYVGRDQVRACEYYSLLQTLSGSKCVVFPCGAGWMRKTVNAGQKGSTRYERFERLEDALKSGVAWGKRKVREAIAEQEGSR